MAMERAPGRRLDLKPDLVGVVPPVGINVPRSYYLR
jgi:hypothetical protein